MKWLKSTFTSQSDLKKKKRMIEGACLSAAHCLESGLQPHHPRTVKSTNSCFGHFLKNEDVQFHCEDKDTWMYMCK